MSTYDEPLRFLDITPKQRQKIIDELEAAKEMVMNGSLMGVKLTVNDGSQEAKDNSIYDNLIVHSIHNKNMITALIEGREQLDSKPVPTKDRVIWNPYTGEMIEVDDE